MRQGGQQQGKDRLFDGGLSNGELIAPESEQGGRRKNGGSTGTLKGSTKATRSG